jgi:hypothetical protein
VDCGVSGELEDALETCRSARLIRLALAALNAAGLRVPSVLFIVVAVDESPRVPGPAAKGLPSSCYRLLSGAGQVALGPGDH